MSMCMSTSVYMQPSPVYVCLSRLRQLHVSKTTCPNFRRISAHVSCGIDSILLCNTLCTSGFVDDFLSITYHPLAVDSVTTNVDCTQACQVHIAEDVDGDRFSPGRRRGLPPPDRQSTRLDSMLVRQDVLRSVACVSPLIIKSSFAVSAARLWPRRHDRQSVRVLSARLCGARGKLFRCHFLPSSGLRLPSVFAKAERIL